MEEIEVGEYVRLEDGIILKYGEKSSTIIENNIYTDYSGEYEWSSTVVKHSPEIIDLIEEGDYVNGCKVYENKKTFLVVYQKVKNSEVDYNYINHDEIKSILTKELYEKNCYKLEV